MDKTIFDFMRDKTEYEFCDGSFSILNNEGDFFVVIPDVGTFPADDGWDIRKILEEKLGKEIRYCSYCGEPMDSGFICADGVWYADEEHFEDMMDEVYGQGEWRLSPNGEEGDCGGYYDCLVDGKWEDTGVFYTEWY